MIEIINTSAPINCDQLNNYVYSKLSELKINEYFGLRLVAKDKNQRLTGLYNDSTALIRDISAFAGKFHIYGSLNPIKKIEGLSLNSLALGSSFKDTDTSRINNILIDVDPKRKSNTSSNDEELGHAWKVICQIALFFNEKRITYKGFFSGNGYHLVIKVPSYEITRSNEIKEFLLFLHKRYSTPEAHVDTGVHNPSRICRIAGTLNVKGVSSKERPHRLSSQLTPFEYLAQEHDILDVFKNDFFVQTKESHIPITEDKGKLSDKTLDFIMHGAPIGQWHNHLIAALFDLKAQGYSQQEAILQMEKASLSGNGKLDTQDLHQIKDIYENRTSKIQFKPKTENSNNDQILDKVKYNLEKIVQMSGVQEKEVNFIWKPYIPKGFVTLFTGDPGSGKSTITTHIIAAISNGKSLWTEDSLQIGNVVIFTAEDPLEEVLKPRLSKAGANMNNVFAFTLPLEFDEIGKQTIREAIALYRPSLLVIDPIVAYIGAKTDTNKANEVREKMLFLSDLTREFNMGILVIRHCAKSSSKDAVPLIYKGHGSIDFVAAVRSEVMLICDPKNQNNRFFGHTKSNLTKLGRTLQLEMTENGPVLNGIEEKDLSSYLSKVQEEESNSSTIIDEITDAINEILSHGPLLQKNFYNELKEAGFTHASIRRGIKIINFIESRRVSFTKGSRGVGAWVICTNEQSQALSKIKFEHLDHLQECLMNWKDQGAQISNAKLPLPLQKPVESVSNTENDSIFKTRLE